MKIFFGLYSELSFSPPPLFEKALSLVYEPVLSFLYNNPGYRVCLFHSSFFSEYLQSEHPEYKALITTLLKRGDLEILSGSFSLSPLSLMHPKDRVNDLEKMTSFIRHQYSYLPTTSFFYEGVWQNGYISSLKSAGIENVVVSSLYGGEPFIMKELGKKINVYPIDNESAHILNMYSRGEARKEEVEERLLSRIKEKEKDGSVVIFLSVDKLISHGEDFSKMLIKLIQKGNGLKIEDSSPSLLGYLPSFWYGEDAVLFKKDHYVYTFLSNDNFRYLYNRYLSLLDSSQNRGNRFLKKEVSETLSSLPLGPLFTFGEDYSPLRKKTRRIFWEDIIQSEKSFLNYGTSPSVKEIDLEDRGENNYILSNKNYLLSFSSFGGSVIEFDSFAFCRNFFDTFPSIKDENVKLKKSFSDEIVLNNKTYSTEDRLFTSEVVDKKRSELSFLLDEDFPILLSKRFKLKQSTLLLDSTLLSKKKESIGSYILSIYIPSDFVLVSSPEIGMKVAMKEDIEEKTIKYTDGDAMLVFSSIKNFILSEKNEKINVNTALGNEEFGLWKKISFSFPIALKEEESVTLRLACKVLNSKKE